MILVLGPIWVLGGQNCQKYSNFWGPFSYRARVIKESWMAASRTEVLLLSLFIESPNFQDVTVFILAVWKYQYNKINSMFLFRVRLLDEGGCQNEWFIFETQVSGLFHYQFCITFWSHFTSFLHWDLFEGLGCLLRLSLVLTIYQGHRLSSVLFMLCGSSAHLIIDAINNFENFELSNTPGIMNHWKLWSKL